MLPIKTTKENDEITKVVIEDVHKIINRIYEAMNEAYNNSAEILESIHKEYDGFEGELIIGTGKSKPCGEDKFNEDIGQSLAFKKAKLNANIKKRNFVRRVIKEYLRALGKINEENLELNSYIEMDIKGIREHNPDYLK